MELLKIMEEIGNIFFFDSDDEFTDFCVKPYATVVYPQNGSPYIEGDYSDEYKQCIEEGKRFIIKDEDSKVYRRNCVCKRVPIKLEDFPSYHRDTLVQLDVDNLEDYSKYLFKEKIRIRKMQKGNNDN